METVQETIATACRLLGHLGLVRETTGHVSSRIDGERMYIRCRGKTEAGLVFTQADAVCSVDFDGKNVDTPGYEPPTELPIHGEIYRARPEVGAVVHAHPRASLICTLMGLELKPIFGRHAAPPIPPEQTGSAAAKLCNTGAHAFEIPIPRLRSGWLTAADSE
jgi:3,4-dihydroxyphthalate decarboxylase